MRAFAALLVLTVPATAAAKVRAFTETSACARQPEATTSVDLWHSALRITWDRVLLGIEL